MKPVVIFGERPGPNTDPLRALYPHTTTGAAAKLIGLIGVSTEFYLENTARFNVFHDGEQLLTLDQARARVQNIMTKALAEYSNPRFVFVGGETLRAAPQFYRHMKFLEIKDLVLYLPHTSGVNRWYNSAENTEAARRALHTHLAGVLVEPPQTSGVGAAAGGAVPPATAPEVPSDALEGLAPVPTGQPGPVAAPTAPEELSEQRFDELLAVWSFETGYMSSVAQMMEHPAVPVLKAQGRQTVQRLLARLSIAEEPRIGWMTLLATMTGAHPVPPEHRGYVSKMRDAWITWGAEQFSGTDAGLQAEA